MSLGALQQIRYERMPASEKFGWYAAAVLALLISRFQFRASVAAHELALIIELENEGAYEETDRPARQEFERENAQPRWMV